MRGFTQLVSALNPKPLATSKEDAMNIRNFARAASSKLATAAQVGIVTMGLVGAAGVVAGVRAGKAVRGTVIEAVATSRDIVAQRREQAAIDKAARQVADDLMVLQQLLALGPDVLRTRSAAELAECHDQAITALVAVWNLRERAFRADDRTRYHELGSQIEAWAERLVAKFELLVREADARA